jgi:hypothetical protein
MIARERGQGKGPGKKARVRGQDREPGKGDRKENQEKVARDYSE